jgi:hypothetical protein
VGWGGWVVACCVQELSAFLAFYAGSVSLLVLGTMREVEVLVLLQFYLAFTEVCSVARKWVSSGFVFVFAGDMMCIICYYLCCYLCCCYYYYLCSSNYCIIGIGVVVIAYSVA